MLKRRHRAKSFTRRAHLNSFLFADDPPPAEQGGAWFFPSPARLTLLREKEMNIPSGFPIRNKSMEIYVAYVKIAAYQVLQRKLQ
jgi:hypothetical protein